MTFQTTPREACGPTWGWWEMGCWEGVGAQKGWGCWPLAGGGSQHAEQLSPLLWCDSGTRAGICDPPRASQTRGGDGPSGPRTHDGDGMGCEQFVHTYEIAAPSCSLKC